jgi:hypothetical protein
MAQDAIEIPPENVELAILGEGEVAISEESAADMSKQIAYRILSAESEDAVLEQAATVGARDILGQPFLIRNVRWLQSKYGEGGPTVFSILEVEMGTDGSRELVTCGGRNVMAQIFQLAKLGKLPSKTPVKFRENETASGYGALWLEKA